MQPHLRGGGPADVFKAVPTGELQVVDRAHGFVFHIWKEGRGGAAPAGVILSFGAGRNTTMRDLRAIVAAARRYGGNRVLWVRAAEAPGEAGTTRGGVADGLADRLVPMYDATTFSF